MKRPFYLDTKHRNEYLRFMLGILEDKYFVSRTRLARGMGFKATYLADFVNDRRTLRRTNLDKIEFFLDDLYESIIEDELDINSFYFMELSESSKVDKVEYAKK